MPKGVWGYATKKRVTHETLKIKKKKKNKTHKGSKVLKKEKDSPYF
jgi:hypothetical protein